jgi:CRISPR/Cas system-associated endonuclease Cas3-HD
MEVKMIDLIFNRFIPTAVDIGIKTALSKPLSHSIAEKKAWINEKKIEIDSVEKVIEKNSKILQNETSRQNQLVSSIKEIDDTIKELENSGIDIPELEDLKRFRSLLIIE